MSGRQTPAGNEKAYRLLPLTSDDFGYVVPGGSRVPESNDPLSLNPEELAVAP